MDAGVDPGTRDSPILDIRLTLPFDTPARES